MLVYIMGRGHSGSTLLDALIGNGPCVTNTGELISGLLNIDSPDRFCSCGKPLAECEFWSNILVDKKELEYLAKMTHVRFFTKGLKNSSNSIFSDINQRLITRIEKESYSDIVVDSSKEPTRGLFLARYTNSKIIHLVRNPENQTASILNRINDGRGLRFLRRRYTNKIFTPIYIIISALSWTVGGLLAEVVRKFAGNRSIRVRYEDLLNDPTAELERIAQFIGCDLSKVIISVKEGAELSVGHTIGGNKFRHSSTFVLNPNSQNKTLPTHYKLLVNILTWPMKIYYGY